MKVYIAGKISGLDYHAAHRKFHEAEQSVRDLGYEPVNPMARNGLDGDGKEHPWAEYMRRDIPCLLECEGIYLLSDWHDSKGARLEKHIADELGFVVIHQEQELKAAA